MAFAAVDQKREQPVTFGARVADAVRQASRLSDEARQFKSMATDTVADGVHAARRAIKTVERRVEDLTDEAIHRVKRQPVRAVAGAFGIGLAVGAIVGWVTGRLERRE
jgi:hypothetical protein